MCVCERKYYNVKIAERGKLMRVVIMKKSVLVRVVVFLVVVVGAVIYAKTALFPDAEVFSTQNGASAVCSVKTDEKIVAITFDTSFGTDRTDDILKILANNGAKATFAVMGAWAQENPASFEKIVKAGHDIMSHSMGHERYTELTVQNMLQDADASRALIAVNTSKDTPYIRPPYGTVNDAVVEGLRGKGYVPVKWSIDAQDWKSDGGAECANRIIENIKPGSIVMMQNNTQDAVDALDGVLKALSERGYKCVGISDMVLPEGYTVDSTGAQSIGGVALPSASASGSVAPKETSKPSKGML